MSTENNVAAQAGDEPMLPKSDWLAHQFEPWVEVWTRDDVERLLRIERRSDLVKRLQQQVNDLCALAESQVSPRATADVERLTNAEIREIMHKSSRYMGQPGYYSDTEFDCLQDVISFARAIEAEAVKRATTKPGA